MKKIKQIKGKINSVIKVPGSKSYTNRALLISALAEGKSKLYNVLDSDDTVHMRKALSLFGIKMISGKDDKGRFLEVNGRGVDLKVPNGELFVGNSGTSIRFLTSYAALATGKVVITGDKDMQKRPIADLVDCLKQLGVEISCNHGFSPVVIEGSENGLVGGKVKIKGDKSSQYLSSVLMVAPYAMEDVEIEIIGSLASKPFIDVTIDVMNKFWVKVKNNNYERFSVKGGQSYQAGTYFIESDASAASYFFAAAAICGGSVTVHNLNYESKQGDVKFVDLLERMGCKVVKDDNSITVIGPSSGELKGINIDMNSMPDVVQTLAVVALFADRKTTIKNVPNLRIKETDRLRALSVELSKITKVKELDDGLVVWPLNDNEINRFSGVSIETYNDHRMAMSFAIAGLRLKGIKIKNPNCVSKTFPNYWEVLEKLYNNFDYENIILIGYRGTGKSVVAKELAKKMSQKLVSLDSEIEKKVGKSINEIVSNEGWDKFREYETKSVKDICNRNSDCGLIVDAGGGIVERKENISILKKKSKIILLTADAKVIEERISKSKNRPALSKDKSFTSEIEDMLKRRRRKYNSAADYIVDTTKLSVKEVVDKIINYLD